MVTQGLGFTAVYSPSNPSLWLLGEHPSISINEERGDSPERVQLPEGRLVKQVAAGRKHVVVMTTTGEGALVNQTLLWYSKNTYFYLGVHCIGQHYFAALPLPPLLHLPVCPLSVHHGSEQLRAVWRSSSLSPRPPTSLSAARPPPTRANSQGTQ